jgi:hypothetical protein
MTTGKEKAAEIAAGTKIWWRRRESNPRPLALCLWLYMLSFRLFI